MPTTHAGWKTCWHGRSRQLLDSRLTSFIRHKHSNKRYSLFFFSFFCSFWFLSFSFIIRSYFCFSFTRSMHEGLWVLVHTIYMQISSNKKLTFCTSVSCFHKVLISNLLHSNPQDERIWDGFKNGQWLMWYWQVLSFMNLKVGCILITDPKVGWTKSNKKKNAAGAKTAKLGHKRKMHKQFSFISILLFTFIYKKIKLK